ncbi:Calcium-transporting ATPase [Handroanthus impetiginosus]|uniref:Calcium-transporting ATPase n=1 Tax=Handroanthus impetiginosus TaxID=429701 RepID=A0A2G9HLQ1_9LAMI|nr:Calcium-transporting ATPase [Handroanthus impetiginosus]
MLPNITTFPPIKFQEKWTVACIVLYVSLSRGKGIVSKNRKMNFSAHSSHAILEPNPVSSFQDEVEDGRRGFNTELNRRKLTEMVKNMNSDNLQSFSGIEDIAKLLKTDSENGINGDEEDLSERRKTFGSNTYQKPPSKGLIHFVVEAFRDTTILILLTCAALSLAFGIREHGGREGYVGSNIFIAVVLVVAVSAASNFWEQ